MQGLAPTLYEDGGDIRDYVNIDDVVDANVLVLTDERAAGRVFNVGGGQPVTTREFSDVVHAPVRLGRARQVTGEYRFGDTRHILSDISALRALGWDPQRTPADSVAAYAAWLKGMDGLDGVLAEANAKMRALGVVAVRKAGRMKAFLLAAGLGTRLRPITDTIPKCMAAIDGQPMLEIWLDAFDQAGVDEVLVNLHYLPDVVRREYLSGRTGPPAVRISSSRSCWAARGRCVANRDWVARTRTCFWPATPTTSPISTCGPWSSAHRAHGALGDVGGIPFRTAVGGRRRGA